MRLLKYLLVAFTLVSWAADQLLAFVPRYSESSDLVITGCILTVLLCALLALIRRNWNSFAIFCFPLAVIFLPGFGVTQASEWLQATGFRIHATPIEDYLSRCRIVTFVEYGKKQQVGECEGIPTSSITWTIVIYDTTGQFVLPRPRRSSGWKSAMGMLSSPDVYTETEGRGSHIFGDFYAIAVRLDELQGG